MYALLPCERVAIVGTTGSGKTSLARNLANRHRHSYPEILRQPEYAHLNVIRLRSRGETQFWFSKLPEHPV